MALTLFVIHKKYQLKNYDFLLMEEIVYSIIIPHYNIPLLLERLLVSIPKRHDVEVIVADDGSPKKVCSELEAMASRRPEIRLLLLEGNLGAGYARNAAIGVARGRWVLFADADDFFVLTRWSSVANGVVGLMVIPNQSFPK